MMINKYILQKKTLPLLQLLNVNNVHPAYSTGIRTHDLQNVSLLPQPLGMGSHPKPNKVFLLDSSELLLSAQRPGTSLLHAIKSQRERRE